MIVESPSKAKTIEKYLAPDFPDFKVIASVGHIIDLPTKSLGVDVENGFAPQYEVIKGKKTIVENLKRLASQAENIYLAPDPDREGEAIAFHIASVVGGGGQKVYRTVFNEVTKEAIRAAIENPTEININLVNAQQARRILDRLVGYKISPLLWQKVRRGISAGRVQSVAMRLICDREREIKAFDPVEYWTISARAEAANPPPFDIRLAKIDGKDPELGDDVSAAAIVAEAGVGPWTIGNVIKREVKKRPFAPFITSTLQQEASRRLRFTARQTMRAAQRLYEGIAVGEEGPVGLITYMRTDSRRLSNTALGMIRGYIGENYDSEYLPEKPRVYAASKGAQDAHEAIRPTDVRRTPRQMARYLDKQMLALYELIWHRSVACQMADAIMERTRIEIPRAERLLFVATGSVVKFNGFMATYEEARDETGKSESDAEGEEKVSEEGDTRLPAVEIGDSLKIEDLNPKQHFTQPPPRFTEASLIRDLEKQGIGRPSTYASIISTIQDREYAEKDRGQFKPTELGFITTDLIMKSFPEIMDVKFTAGMEKQLDEVEEGKKDWVELLEDFYKPFAKKLEIAQKEMRNIKAEMEPTEFVCEKCNSAMVVRWGRNGKFLACSSYPDCRNTKPIAIDSEGKVTIVEDEVTDQECVNCGKKMVIKSGRRGRFLACSGYPDCKTTRPIPIGVPCARPGCKGELLERRSGRGRVFYSCGEYPECRFSVWEIPTKVPCEVCGVEHWAVGKAPNQKAFDRKSEDCPFNEAYVPKPEGEEDAKPRKAYARKKAPAKKKAARKKAPARKKSLAS